MGNKSSKKKHQYQIPANAAKPYPPSKPSFDVYDDDSVYVEWTAPNWTGGCPLIGFVLQFKTLNEISWTSTEPIAETSCWLRNLQLGQIYNFRVIAENLIGYSYPSELSDELLVTNENTAPAILVPLNDISVLEFERVEFSVRATGRPRPTYTWYSNGLEIIPAPNIILNGSRIIIKQIPKKMNGKLKCLIENELGFAETICALTVGVPPRIFMHTSSAASGLNYEDDSTENPTTRHYLCRVGEMLRMKLKVEGIPEPKLHWSHNGIPIHTQSESLLMGSWATLKIDNIAREDRGEYELWVENEYGNDAANVLVTVADRPTPLKTAPVIHLQRDDSCFIEWAIDIDADDGGCPIQTYIVEYYRVGWDVWLTAATTRNTTARIRELIPGSKYIFRVKCENPYGVSDPSPPSNPLFIPELSSGLMSTLAEETGSKMDVAEEDEEDIEYQHQRLSASRPSSSSSSTTPSTIITLENKPLKQESYKSYVNVSSPSSSAMDSYRRPTTSSSSPIAPRVITTLSPASTPVAAPPSPTLLSPRPPGSPRTSPSTERRSSAVLDHYFTTKRSSVQTDGFPTDYVKNSVFTPPETAKPKNSSGHYIYETDSDDNEDGLPKSEDEEEAEVVEVKSSLTLFKSGNCAIKTSKEELTSSAKTSRTSLLSGLSSGDLQDGSRLSKHGLNKSVGAVDDQPNKTNSLTRRNPFAFFQGQKGLQKDAKTTQSQNLEKEIAATAAKTGALPAEEEEKPAAVVADKLLLNFLGLILFLFLLFVKYLNFGVSIGLIGFVLYKWIKLCL